MYTRSSCTFSDWYALCTFIRQRAKCGSISGEINNEKKEHGDTVRMQTEQVKLDVVQEVRAKFDEIWEGAE